MHYSATYNDPIQILKPEMNRDPTLAKVHQTNCGSLCTQYHLRLSQEAKGCRSTTIPFLFLRSWECSAKGGLYTSQWDIQQSDWPVWLSLPLQKGSL